MKIVILKKNFNLCYHLCSINLATGGYLKLFGRIAFRSVDKNKKENK